MVFFAVLKVILMVLPSMSAQIEVCPKPGQKCAPVDFNIERKESATAEGCFHSAALKQNVCYAVTFPRGYRGTTKTPYAVFLHGRGGSHRQFSSLVKACKEKGPETVFTDAGPPVPIISPRQTVHTYWKNGLNGARVADMVTEDLLKEVATLTNGRLEPNPGLFGISMGGHGAFYLGVTRRGVFSRAYSISPIVRSQETLEPQDIAALGSGLTFQKKDPLSFVRQEGFDPGLPFHAEIAKDDPLYLRLKSTREFIRALKEKFPGSVQIEKEGGHGRLFWCGALKRALADMEKLKIPVLAPTQDSSTVPE